MSQPIIWRSHYRRGDVFWHALYLRALGGSHVFYCQEEHHHDLRDALEGRDVTLKPIQDHPEAPDAIDAWIGSDQVSGRSYFSAGCPNDIIGFLLDWFGALSEQIGAPRVFNERADLLANYPALYRGQLVGCMSPIIDLLVINAEPQSAQCKEYVPAEMDALLQRLVDARDRAGRHNCIACTNPTPVQMPRIDGSLANIGYHSLFTKAIVAVATGPMWPTWNVANRMVPRYLLLDPIRIDYGPGTTINHAANVSELTVQLERDGWL